MRSVTSPGLALRGVLDLPCSLPDSDQAEARSACASPLGSSTEAPLIQLPAEGKVENVLSYDSLNTGGESKQVGTRDDMDMQEVERGFSMLQEALAKVRRSSLLEMAKTNREKSILDWTDSMSKTAASEMAKLKRMQQPGSFELAAGS
jgi:hypothetical protein